MLHYIDFHQLQIEHALELDGRRLSLFLDAGERTAAPYELRRVEAVPGLLHTTHALAPEAVLDAAREMRGA